MGTKISLVIPVYNLEGYLPATLDSVLAQTYENLEIIVVNDGSADGTAAVMEAYAAKDVRIKALHQANAGVSAARLRGIAEATGEYIGFVDGDDFVEPEMFEKLLRNAQEHCADISHCGYRMVFPSGRVDWYYNTGRREVLRGTAGCSSLLDAAYIEPALVNKLYRKELFAGLAEWLDCTIRINEDLLMNFYLFRRAEVCIYEDICLYHYVPRKGSAATSRLNEHKLKDPLKVLHHLMEETTAVPEWNRIVKRRLTYQLITNATVYAGERRDLVVPYRRTARKELRSRLWDVLTGNACGTKLKIMALWAAVWPASYGWVHRIHGKITGMDRKFAVE